jgi:hypothetical protein
MKKLILALFIITLSILIFTPISWSQELVCVEANGLDWCYNPNACGQACNDVCVAGGRQPIADNVVWFEAQNTEEECIVISEALGMGNNVVIEGFSFACLEDSESRFHGSGLNAPLLCSNFDACPERHRTRMDDIGFPCDSPEFSRRSICPCSPPPTVPTLSEWGLISMIALLGIIGFIAIRRRNVSA